MAKDTTYKSEQAGYQFKRSGADDETYKPKQANYSYSRKAAGGAVGAPVADAARNSGNMPAMKKGGMMHQRKDHVRRKI